MDKQQDDSSRITAIRETFEESGLLLASATSGTSTPFSDCALDGARRNIHERKLLFRTFLAEHHLKPDTDSLLPFTQWITPPNTLRWVSFIDLDHQDSNILTGGSTRNSISHSSLLLHRQDSPQEPNGSKSQSLVSDRPS